MTEIKYFLEIIGLIFSGIIALGMYIKKWLINPFNEFKININSKIENYEKTLVNHTHTLSELKLNGGNSIKDIINKIDKTLDNNTIKLNSIAAMVKASYEFEEDGIFIADSLGSCYYFNKAYLEMTGLTFNEAINYGWANALHPADHKKVLESWKVCIETRSNIELVHRYKHIKTKRIIKTKVSWQVQASADNPQDLLLVFGRVKKLE